MYKGKVLVIVNVASNCGLTSSNYAELVQLYERYHADGLEILAFPCNQFGGQEPGTSEEIKAFVAGFKCEFRFFQKGDVNGPGTRDVFRFIKARLPGASGSYIKWNFTKFLIDRNGQPAKRFAPTDSPLLMEDDINDLLAATPEPEAVEVVSTTETTAAATAESSAEVTTESATATVTTTECVEVVSGEAPVKQETTTVTTTESVDVMSAAPTTHETSTVKTTEFVAAASAAPATKETTTVTTTEAVQVALAGPTTQETTTVKTAEVVQVASAAPTTQASGSVGGELARHDKDVTTHSAKKETTTTTAPATTHAVQETHTSTVPVVHAKKIITKTYTVTHADGTKTTRTVTEEVDENGNVVETKPAPAEKTVEPAQQPNAPAPTAA
ncbi:hypothetical protein PINS_up020406 [Pythium insidiosum]|nr:hypothetical protein PINS_up020406 [Pythium insidiosum]